MTNPPDYGDLHEVSLVGKTREWFKKDITTLKKSVRTTINNTHWILLVTVIFSIIINFSYERDFDVLNILFWTITFLPISLLAFFTLHALKTKGYDIQAP